MFASMKRIFIWVGIMAGLSLASFTVAYTAGKSTAEANQLQGMYIFTDCTPVQPYTVLGTVEVTTAGSGQYTAVRDKLAAKAKKSYPTADGLLLRLQDGKKDRADVLQFK